MRDRFHLDTLLVVGTDKPDAVVHFKPGLNVVSGPSDTGKSYILKCIDFMLGSSKKPKSINESKGYSTAFLTIRTMSDQLITLERDLKGRSFRCFFDQALPIPANKEGEVLSGKHKAEAENTVSALLLRLVGLADKKVLKASTDGTTRSLSFRDVADLIIVDECDIVASTRR